MDRKQDKLIGILSSWAFAFGCAVGWGCFMNPSNIFLPKAGPLGSFLGITVATVMMLLIGTSVTHMAKKYPGDSGIHVYIGNALGADHGFLSAWALLLAYLSIMWANATAVILLIRAVFGDVLKWGFHYQIADYDVYLGEILMTIAVIAAAGLLSIYGRTLVRILHIVFAVLQILLLVAVFVCVAASPRTGGPIDLGFAGNSIPETVQVFNVAMLAPWMFVGFEAVTYMLGSGGRDTGGLTGVISTAVLCGFLAYFLPVLIPVIAVPADYGSWKSYLDASASGSGLLAMPVFYSVYDTLGRGGLYALVAAVICAIITSLFGLYRVSSRLLYTMAQEELLPAVFSRKNKNNEPQAAMLLVMAVSVLIPFFGRTAIGWIVDVTTISATIVYVYITVCSYRLAASDEEAPGGLKTVSVFGMVFSVVSFLFLLIPNIFSENKLATESYFVLAVWSILGLLFYREVFRRDEKHRYGRSTVMWVLMLFLIFFSSIMWIRQRTSERLSMIADRDAGLQGFVNANAVMQMAVVIIAILLMFSLFSIMRTREHETDKRRIESEAKSEAKTSFLSSMSHDIRTPMNAILGFTDLALDTHDAALMEDYLHKIRKSGDHLLALINDVLEMSRIESGKLELHAEPVNLTAAFSDLESILRGQAEARGHTFTVDASKLTDENVLCDRLRLNQILLNLGSNAIKYTPDGGKIEISIIQTGDPAGGKAKYHISVRDNGMGMTPEFAARVFDAFERDKSAEREGIQGTGLGMAITRRIVVLMGGDIQVKSAPGQGTEFTIDLALEVCAEDPAGQPAEEETGSAGFDLTGKRALLADDIEINRRIAAATLRKFGLEVEEAADGREAYERVLAADAGYYDVVVMDIQMPGMDGYEATRAIRGIEDPGKAGVPVIAMTANAFEEDIRSAQKAGMNGHVAKPIDRKKLLDQLVKVLTATSS